MCLSFGNTLMSEMVRTCICWSLWLPFILQLIIWLDLTIYVRDISHIGLRTTSREELDWDT